MAADTGVWQGDLVVGSTTKIHRLKDGRLYAGAGDRSLTYACRQWLMGEADKPSPVSDDNRFGALILATTGVWRVDHNFELYPSATHDFVVEGAHSEFLLGAMAAGASAEEAVRLAIIYGEYAAGKVQVERL